MILLNSVLHFLYDFVLEPKEYQWALLVPTTTTWCLPSWDTQPIGLPSPVPINVGCFGLPSISEPRTGHSIPDVTSPVQRRGGESPPSTCWQHFLLQPRIPLAFLAIRAHYSLVANLFLSGHSGPSPQSSSPEGQLIACRQLETST